MHYAQIRKFDVTNGPGVRTTLFVSGCTHKCNGCFNDVQQDFNYGNTFTKETEENFIKAASNPQIKGVSILGGEPMQQTYDDTLLTLLKRLNKDVKKPLWMWSGCTFEDILKDSKRVNLLKEVDVLVDGQFELDKRDLSLKYRGSRNQRILDVKASLKAKEPIELSLI